MEEAQRETADALYEAICGRIDLGWGIPELKARQIGERLVSVPVSTALNAIVYSRFCESGQTNVAFAGR